ncbi:MAG TPA: F0F1 ATP synthase subunit delta [Bryobacteraceae bacterium]|nr:F0F1 ATP synthase subunit delta [Bryobacteraceae bacterium]
MQLNWSTFLLEVVNFLILVWILKRFLYKPVLDAVARRKAAIDKTLSDAEVKHKQAEALELQYQNRLADWGREKEGLRSALTEELRVQRERLMAELQKSLEQERDKEHVLAKRRLTEMEDHAAEQGTAKGVQFTARLLERIAGPELESRLLGLALEDLSRLPAVELKALQEACRVTQRRIKVASAFPLSEDQRSQIVQALQKVTHENVAATFEEDFSLMAGLRISAGPWMVRANLSDELQFFAEMVKHDARQ